MKKMLIATALTIAMLVSAVPAFAATNNTAPTTPAAPTQPAIHIMSDGGGTGEI